MEYCSYLSKFDTDIHHRVIQHVNVKWSISDVVQGSIHHLVSVECRRPQRGIISADIKHLQLTVSSRTILFRAGLKSENPSLSLQPSIEQPLKTFFCFKSTILYCIVLTYLITYSVGLPCQTLEERLVVLLPELQPAYPAHREFPTPPQGVNTPTFAQHILITPNISQWRC